MNKQNLISTLELLPDGEVKLSKSLILHSEEYNETGEVIGKQNNEIELHLDDEQGSIYCNLYKLRFPTEEEMKEYMYKAIEKVFNEMLDEGELSLNVDESGEIKIGGNE